MTESKLNVVVPKDYSGAPIEVVLREEQPRTTGDKRAGKSYDRRDD